LCATRSIGIALQALLDEPPDLLVLDAWQRVAVGLERLVVAAEPAKHVGACEVERQGGFEDPRALDAVQELEGLGWAGSERDGHGAIQLDDGRLLVAEQLIVQHAYLPPIRGRRGRSLGMDGRDRTLDLIRSRPTHAERLLDEPS